MKKIIVENNFLNLEIKDRLGIPDEARVEISLTNKRGQYKKISAWEQNAGSLDDYLRSDKKNLIQYMVS